MSIVEPDFWGHWKTEMLVGLTQDESSPVHVVRLWTFCHQRRAWMFPNMTPEKLKAICRWKGDANEIWRLLHECEFVRDEDGQFVVHDWDTVNATLVRNWKNGVNGGRKPKTQAKPKRNPSETQKGDSVNPNGTDRKEGKGRERKGVDVCASAAADLLSDFQDCHASCASVGEQPFVAAIAACRQMGPAGEMIEPDVEEAIGVFSRQMAGVAKIPFPLREFEKYLRHSVEEQRVAGEKTAKKKKRSADRHPAL